MKRHPTFAPAHAGPRQHGGRVVRALPRVTAVSAISPEDALTIARPAALRAIELDPLLAEAHAAMGYVHALERDWAGAEASFRHALSLNPAITTIHTDFVLSTLCPQGKLNEALLLLEAARRTDPLSLDVRRVMATIQISAGLYDQAIDNCRHVLARGSDVSLRLGGVWPGSGPEGRLAAGIAMLEKHRGS